MIFKLDKHLETESLGDVYLVIETEQLVPQWDNVGRMKLTYCSKLDVYIKY